MNQADKQAMIEHYGFEPCSCPCGFSATIIDWNFPKADGTLVPFPQLTIGEAKAVIAGVRDGMFCPKCDLPYGDGE